MFWGEIGGLVTMHPIIGSVDRRRPSFLPWVRTAFHHM